MNYLYFLKQLQTSFVSEKAAKFFIVLGKLFKLFKIFKL